ncbi:MAG TPA: hypothetical protein VHB70_11165 [Parafilimonas sp.]|nr:hypothetical protein [Parafilimonas sp.]
MRNQIFISLNGKNYLERIKPTLVGPLIFASFVIAIGYLGTDSLWTVLAGLALFTFYLTERLRWGRIYITEICELPGNKLKITYLDKNQVKEYVANKNSLQLQRHSVWYKLKADREEYLVIKDEEKGFTLKQYALGDWENQKIEEFVKEWEPEIKETELAY